MAWLFASAAESTETAALVNSVHLSGRPPSAGLEVPRIGSGEPMRGLHAWTAGSCTREFAARHLQSSALSAKRREPDRTDGPSASHSVCKRPRSSAPNTCSA
jgi:hypothetical protein